MPPRALHPKIKLTYFDIKGRAEPIRLALAIGKVDFEDHRLARGEWPSIKPSTPYGSLPTALIDDTTTAAQSDALLRYAGKLGGLYPKVPIKALFVDEVLDVCNDLSIRFFSYRGPDKEQLREAREKVMAEDVPRYWGGLEKRLEVMKAGPFVLGDDPSIADVKIYALFTTVKSGFLDFVDPEAFEKYPLLHKIYHHFSAIPEVVEWNAKH